MTSEGLGEMFEGDLEDMSSENVRSCRVSSMDSVFYFIFYDYTSLVSYKRKGLMFLKTWQTCAWLVSTYQV